MELRQHLSIAFHIGSGSVTICMQSQTSRPGLSIPSLKSEYAQKSARETMGSCRQLLPVPRILISPRHKSRLSKRNRRKIVRYWPLSEFVSFYRLVNFVAAMLTPVLYMSIQKRICHTIRVQWVLCGRQKIHGILEQFLMVRHLVMVCNTEVALQYRGIGSFRVLQ